MSQGGQCCGYKVNWKAFGAVQEPGYPEKMSVLTYPVAHLLIALISRLLCFSSVLV